jgi:hypothetical protein
MVERPAGERCGKRPRRILLLHARTPILICKGSRQAFLHDSFPMRKKAFGKDFFLTAQLLIKNQIIRQH